MRNSFISILLLLLISSCDDIPNEVIENNFDGIRVMNLTAPDVYEPQNSSEEFNVLAGFNQTNNIDSVWFNVSWTGDNKTVVRKIYMTDTGDKNLYGDEKENDKVYSGKTSSLNDESSGKYKLEVFSLDKQGNQKIVALRYFQLTSMAQNIAPVLNNLVMADSVNRGEKFVFKISATDQNGLTDVIKVYYELYRPDGSKISNSQGISEFPLFDNGLADDTQANDGEFTSALTFPVDYETGTYRFDFTAVDKTDAKSNIISHNLVVK